MILERVNTVFAPVSVRLPLLSLFEVAPMVGGQFAELSRMKGLEVRIATRAMAR